MAAHVASTGTSPPRPMSAVALAGGGIGAGQSKVDDIAELSSPIWRHIKELYDELEHSFGWLEGKDMGVFLTEVQKHLESEEGSLAKFMHTEASLANFVSYLCSPQANAVGRGGQCDLTYPLSNYFISSSHNTYLTGNQLASAASVEEYQNVLLRGCRCVEIDVWNGKLLKEDTASHEHEHEHHGLRERLGIHRKGSKSKNQHETSAASAGTLDVAKSSSSTSSVKAEARAEPRVLHGHTLTKEVPFRKVCEAIRDSAFVTSDLPVIVSLEIHADHEQQELIVETIHSVWNGLLVQLPANSSDIRLPAPGDLRNKILIKVKYTPPEAVGKVDSENLEGVRPISPPSDEQPSGQPVTKKAKMLEALSELGIYTRGYHFKNFNQPEARIPTHVFSLAEDTIIEAHQAEAEAILDHNKNFLMRAYPKGFRVSSSNFNPVLFWRLGVQFVAINWQSCDQGTMLNEGMFATTGGWVLKPEALRSSPTNTAHISPSNALKVLNLTFEVFAAQSLPASHTSRIVRPYIKFTLHLDGPPKDGKLKAELKARGHGPSSDFGREAIQFRNVAIHEEQLCFVRVQVMDDIGMHKDELVAWACIRLDRLRAGFRFIRLFDAMGKATDAAIFMGITKEVKGEMLEQGMGKPTINR